MNIEHLEMTTNRTLGLHALRVGALASCFSLLACGGYEADPEPIPGSGGQTSAGGTAGNTGGSTAAGGSAASGGDTGTPGSGGAEGSGGGGREPVPEASCDNVEACGGDVLGVWFAMDQCLTIDGTADLSGLGIGCDEGPVTGELQVTGNWTVGDDGILADNTQTTGEVHIQLASECLDVSGTRTDCVSVGNPLASAGFESASCVASETIEDGCDCTGVVNQKASLGFIQTGAAPEGLYTVDGNSLTFTGYEEVAYDFCVDGSFMMVTPTTTNINGPLTGTIVLQKQQP